MMALRRANERGHANFGWLDSNHTFSFGSYYDPRNMGFGHLRVINEDRVQPGQGFGTHPHQNMEIISYVLEGALEHRDSMGTGSVIRPGDVQLMSAGTGVTHSEYNASDSESVHFLQIWILPERRGTKPRYDQRAFDPSERRGKLRLIVSPDGAEGSLTVGQDMRLYSTLLESGEAVEFQASPEHRQWLQVARGEITVGDTTLSAGDGLAIIDEPTLRFEAKGSAEVLLFDLV